MILAILAAVLLVVGLLLHRSSAPPVAGDLVYSDTDRHAVPAPINSHKSGLTGRPDYVYRVKALCIPVELKKHRAGKFGPRVSDVIQLLTYCIILEDNGETVTHGLVEYSDRRFPVPYGPEERRKVLEAAKAIRADRRSGTAQRSHSEAWRCRSCGMLESCNQRLVEARLKISSAMPVKSATFKGLI